MEVEEDNEIFRDLITQALKFFDENNKFKLLPKIFSKIKDLSSDTVFRDIVFHHIKTLQDILPKLKQKGHFYDLKFVSVEECLAFHISKFFLEKIGLFPITATRPFLEDFDEPVESIEIESFLRSNKDELPKLNFIKNLKKNDVLYAEVTDSDLNKNNGDFTQLQIIAKVQANNYLVYHLNIFAYMFKTHECGRLKIDGFKPFEVLKVIVLGKCSFQDEEKIFVTTNNNILKLKDGDLLGIISAQDLPFNLQLFKTAKGNLSYANYLRSHPNFNHSCLKEVIKSVGIDPYSVYSFTEKKDGDSFKTSKCYEELLDRAKPDDIIDRKKSQIYLDEAKILVEKNDITNALPSFDEALKFWPKNFQVYELRGKMYFDMAGKKDAEKLLKAYLDFETALKLNRHSVLSKTCMESILIRLAKRQIKKKNYEEVKFYLTKALRLNKNNFEADLLMKRLEAKKEQIHRKEEKNLMQLQQTKERIVQRLKSES